MDIYLHVCMMVCAHTCPCMLKVWMKLIPRAGVSDAKITAAGSRNKLQVNVFMGTRIVIE